jgi:hypothetical protein
MAEMTVAIKDQEAIWSSRPMKGEKRPNFWAVEDPVTGIWDPYEDWEITVLGYWIGPSVYLLGEKTASWQAYAKHQAGQVLRQHDLVDKLIEVGITRFEKLDYVSRQSPYKTDLRLNYDELDSLLPHLEDHLR